MSLSPAVFFDRDGVLVEAPVVDGQPKSARSIEDLKLIPAAVLLCSRLARAEIPMFMITNQPDIARKKVARSMINKQNAIIQRVCQLTDVRVCPHDERDNCNCRKPKPGMITDIAAANGIDVGSSVVIGDRWRDIEAGKQVGSKTVFIDYGYAERQPVNPTAIVNSVDDLEGIVFRLLRL